MRLTELNPKATKGPVEGSQTLTFRCPKCQLGAMSVHIWTAAHREVTAAPTIYAPEGYPVKIHQGSECPVTDFNTLSVQPSVDAVHRRRPGVDCAAWHGFITNGEAA